jgi:hypothetical protein
VVFSVAVRDTRAKGARVLEVRPLGCRELRAPTWRSLTSLYAADPRLRAARIGALINFIAPSVQAFVSLSSAAQSFSVVSRSPAVESVSRIYFKSDGYYGLSLRKDRIAFSICEANASYLVDSFWPHHEGTSPY